MISYTDYKDTKPFIDNSNSRSKIKNDKLIIEIINKELKKIFNINIPDPIKLHSYYWINGCHYWRKNYDSEFISKFLINPIDNIYICGEAYSLNNQAWIEGALETSMKVINKIHDNLRNNIEW
jgi:monoamine oxidase